MVVAMFCASRYLGGAFSLLALGCSAPEASSDSPSAAAGFPPFDRAPAPETDGVYGFAGGCYSVEGFDGVKPPSHLAPASAGTSFAFSEATLTQAARFHLRPSDLGTYLFYDSQRHYLTAEADGDSGFLLSRAARLDSDVLLFDDTFRSPAEWTLAPSARDPERFQLKHYQTGQYLTLTGLTESSSDAAIISFFPQDGCVDYPELSLDAQGRVEPKQWEDGDVFGFAEIHAHMMTNFGFGGTGMLHGAPFHRLGVEHALPSCEAFHGPDGRRDLAGLFFDGGRSLDVDELLPILSKGESPEFNHHTDGYPEFTGWPNSWGSSTHQTMYYRWLERAYLSGLRLLVQHATGNSVLCEFVLGLGTHTPRYSCNDMVTVDRSIQETKNLERYIDAQAGGPGKGWFRIVVSPEEARQVINQGKLAVVLGIEISNLFDCFSSVMSGEESCTPESVQRELEHYHQLGVRAIFPVHKYDNAFSAGDGHGGIIELGNLINSGHYSSFTDDCPGPDAAFDGGGVTFGGLNKPRERYDAPPPLNMKNFKINGLASLAPILEELRAPALEGNYCQNHGMTDLGERLLGELMVRGMLIDIAHFPQRSLGRAYDILEANDYPATKTHGNSNDGRIYRLGGLTGTGLGRCANPDVPGELSRGFRERVAFVAENGAYPAEAFSFDFNGFAGGPRPRFGEDSRCGDRAQTRPVEYPFTSFDGHVTFETPRLGSRDVDFNTEGMIHIGLLPELIEDARRDGATDEDLEPLFRSAEAYIRMWEKAEARGAALRR